ncbi:MAG: FadR/GntR family transcriptional regulator [Acidobacteriota bacterium]
MALSASSKRKKIRFAVVGNRDGLVDRVVQAIEAQIQTGRLTVGMKLPPEREFSETLGVSRPVVREAVRILTTRGQLKTQHGVGTTVSSVGCNEIVKPLTLFLRTRGEVVNIKHLHQVRSILEVESAGLAAEQRTQDDIGKLTAICNSMEEHANDPANFSFLDYEYHRWLSEMTHNPLLCLLLDTVHEMMAEVRSLISVRQGLFERVMPSHRRILEAITAGDAAAARTAMREHLDIALEIQAELIATQKGGSPE